MHNPDWFKKAVRDKEEAIRRAAHQRHYERILRYEISRRLELALERIKNRTRYLVEVKQSSSFVEVHIRHPSWKCANLFDVRFKLEASHEGIFLSYEAVVQAQSPFPIPTILSSNRKRVDRDIIDENKIIEWLGQTAELSIQSLPIAKYV